MVLVARDLMNGNLRLADMGFKEEAGGYDAIAAGFQGKRQWTDGKLNGDVMETLLNTSFDSDGMDCVSPRSLPPREMPSTG